MSVQTLAVIAALWAVLVIGIQVYQAIYYTGFYSVLSEWQFARWERMFPIATIGLVTLLLTFPFIVLIIWRIRRDRKLYGAPTAQDALARDRTISRWLLGLGAGLFVIAAALSGYGLTIGGLADKGPTVVDPAARPPADSGWVQMRGTLLNSRLGFYKERFLVAGRELYVVPVTEGRDATSIRYFAEVAPTSEASQPTIATVEGILRRASLPGGLRTLYENEGLSLANPTYVVFRDRASAQWPFFSAAGDLALLSLLCLLVFFLFRLRARRQKAKMKEAESAA